MTDLPLLDDNSFLASDMSPFVVHFTKNAQSISASDVCRMILDQQVLLAGKSFGTGKEHPYCPKSVCFSEVPLKESRRISRSKGQYGLGFHKEFIVERGGGPILYAYKDTPHSKAFKEMVDAATGDPNDPIWGLAPFVDRPGWHPTMSGDVKYFFEWEREWRHVGDLKFLETDISFLILPEHEHSILRSYFSAESRSQDLPRYLSLPFICQSWDDSTVKETLRQGNVKSWYSSI